MGEGTNFPSGLRSRGVPVLGAGGGIPTTTGSYFFVDSSTGLSGNTGKTADVPLATVDQAINKCTANKGDVIVVMPNHSETLSGAGSITCDVAGVTIVGVGSKGQRPAFSLTATASSIVVSAADVTWRNCTFSSGIAELVLVFDVTGAGLTIDHCAVTPTGTSMINFLTAATLANYLTISNGDFVTTAIPTADNYFIHLVGTDNFVLANNHFQVLTSNNAGSGILLTDGTLTANMLVIDNIGYVIGTSVISYRILTNSTGLMLNNQVGTTKTDADNTIVSDKTYKFNNLTTNDTDGSGFVAPTIDSAG